MQKAETCAVGYARVSTEEQTTGVSLEDQERTIRDYCEQRGLRLVEVVTDGGVSARVPLPERKGGARLLRLPAGYHVVTPKLDRMFRSVLDCATTMKQWQDQGIDVHIINFHNGEPISTCTATGRLLLWILAAFAEWERELISERTRNALAYRRKQGLVYSHVPFGMQNQNGRLLHDAREMAVLAKVHEWHSQGVSTWTIANWLNEMGVKPRRGKRWYHTSVAKVIARIKREGFDEQWGRETETD